MDIAEVIIDAARGIEPPPPIGHHAHLLVWAHLVFELRERGEVYRAVGLAAVLVGSMSSCGSGAVVQ